MPDDDAGADPKPMLIRQVEGQVARDTGRRYQIDLAALDAGSLRELARPLRVRDLDYEKDAAVRRARTEPWRR